MLGLQKSWEARGVGFDKSALHYKSYLIVQLNLVLSWASFRCICDLDSEEIEEREKETQRQRGRCFSNFFKRFFYVDRFKVSIKFITFLLLFYVLTFWL